MNICNWPEATPPGHPHALCLAPFHPAGPPWNIPLGDLPGWCEAHHWSRDQPQSAILAVGGYQEIQTTKILADASGQVTVDSIAQHIAYGMAGWDRLLNHYAGTLQTIANLGYQIGAIFLDMEAGLCNRGMRYVTHWTEPATADAKAAAEAWPFPPVFSMLSYHQAEAAATPSEWLWMTDVIRRLAQLYPTGNLPVGRLPNLDIDQLCETNVYGVRRVEQQMILWDAWIAQRNARKWRDVFLRPARLLFGADVIVNNYGACNYTPAQAITWPHGHPRPDAAIYGHSSPVLYLSADTGFTTLADVRSHLAAVSPGRSICPWTGTAGRDGWHETPEIVAELENELRRRGCPWIGRF